MARSRLQLSTGLPQLDHVFRGLMAGDNLVFRVDTIQDYRPFVQAYASHARETRQRLVYFRFADHPPLLEEGSGARIRDLDPEEGFEPFIAEIHQTINEEGRGTLYLFDCLSELAPDWNSDRMLGNFFMLTCPHLYDRAAVAYFAILRDYHSFHAMRPISNTTQVLVDAFERNGKLYIQPIKVQYRHSATMYMLHAMEGEKLLPVTQSCVITETLANMPWRREDSASHLLGFWSRTFAEAEATLEEERRGTADPGVAESCFQKLTRMLISREEKVLRLAEEHFTLADLVAVRRRMIGTGLIGGKAVGMLLARKILERSDPRWSEILETHDSFYVGADVFYTYLVQNGCWWMIQKHRADQHPDDETETARRRILAGEFPEYIVKQFADMLDYFGQSPIIVRSSSLLEDNFGNAFAGKYESVFCANQGGQHKRLEDFLCAVRTVYASTLNEEALAYRAKRGLLRNDEQMALLIQRVSGASYGSLFYPQAAGVGFSFNPYVWHQDIDPEAGMLRLVFGVGTRAVDRADDDYTRVVALNAPTRRPEANEDKVRRYAQRRVDVIDLEANHLLPAEFADIIERSPGVPLDMFVSRDRDLEKALVSRGMSPVHGSVLTFDKLLQKTRFVEDMRDLLRILRQAYDHDVDVEFTLNFFDQDSYKISLVQCRPLQVQGTGDGIAPPENIPSQDLVLEAKGAVIGRSAATSVDWIVYVVPAKYSQLSESRRYAVARVIAEVTNHPALAGQTTLLIGPGRWGTTTPSLGVPVTFVDIHEVAILCEIECMHETLVPDASLGTHFFNELVESDMIYMAVNPSRPGNALNSALLEREDTSMLTGLLRDQDELGDVVRVIRAEDMAPGRAVTLNSDCLKQRVVCYLEDK